MNALGVEETGLERRAVGERLCRLASNLNDTSKRDLAVVSGAQPAGEHPHTVSEPEVHAHAADTPGCPALMDQGGQLTGVKRGRLLDKDMEPVRERPRNVASLLERRQCDDGSIRLEAPKLVNRGSHHADVPL